MKEMSYLHDPCPLPDKERKRSLNQKERLIYAPMSGVGGIVYDKDAVYIDLGGSHTLKQDEHVRIFTLLGSGTEDVRTDNISLAARTINYPNFIYYFTVT